MANTSVNCPNCKQLITADIDQLFDVNQRPDAKQRLLSGAYNYVQCPTCGYQGNLATPIIYHDPEKELLLTFIPPEINLPPNEKEKMIGSLINQVVNNLPPEKRKGYLFQPKELFTLQSMIEKVLEADGITREMIDAQEERLKLIQRLMEISDESDFVEVVKEEDALIDADFFAILNRLVQASAASGDQDSTKLLSEMQKKLISLTTYGKKLEEQSKDIEAVMADLQALGEDVSRDDVLDLVVNAKNETSLRALVSFVRPIMDYSFFQLLSERIDRARADGRARLTDLRTKLLEMTQEIDQQLEQHVSMTRQNLEKILEAEDINQVMAQYFPAVDEYFVHEVNQQLDEARQSGDMEKSGKLQQILDILAEASTPPPEFELVQTYLDAQDEQARQQFLEENEQKIDQQFMDILATLVSQTQNNENPEITERVMDANSQALRFSMSKNLQS